MFWCASRGLVRVAPAFAAKVPFSMTHIPGLHYTGTAGSSTLCSALLTRIVQAVMATPIELQQPSKRATSSCSLGMLHCEHVKNQGAPFLMVFLLLPNTSTNTAYLQCVDVWCVMHAPFLHASRALRPLHSWWSACLTAPLLHTPHAFNMLYVDAPSWSCTACTVFVVVTKQPVSAALLFVLSPCNFGRPHCTHCARCTHYARVGPAHPGVLCWSGLMCWHPKTPGLSARPWLQSCACDLGLLSLISGHCIQVIPCLLV